MRFDPRFQGLDPCLVLAVKIDALHKQTTWHTLPTGEVVEIVDAGNDWVKLLNADQKIIGYRLKGFQQWTPT